MAILSFILLAAIAYLAWRIADQIPDIIFRMSEIQRDVAELRRMQLDSEESSKSTASAARHSRKSSTSRAAKATTKASSPETDSVVDAKNNTDA